MRRSDLTRCEHRRSDKIGLNLAKKLRHAYPSVCAKRFHNRGLGNNIILNRNGCNRVVQLPFVGRQFVDVVHDNRFLGAEPENVLDLAWRGREGINLRALGNSALDRATSRP